MPQNLKKLYDVSPADLKGKKVIVRCDFNLTIDVDSGKVLDDLRVRKTLPTIQFLRNAGASIILISHIEGKNASQTGGVDSLVPVAKHISQKFAVEFGLEAGQELTFIEDYLTDEGILATKQHVLNMGEGEVCMFENLRMDGGEKKNDEAFAAKLAQYAEIYVNDAFAVSHRAHASVTALPKLLPHYAGMQLMSEIDHLSKVFNPQRPFVFILGGAKFDTKLPLIDKFLTSENGADNVLLGGALLNDLLKAKGYSVGKSLVAKNEVDLSRVISNPKLIIPDDVVVQEGDSATGGLTIARKPVDGVSTEDSIMDVGPSMTEKLKEILKTAKFVLWNGPMGNYELGFEEQTIGMADAIVSSGVQSVVGGGDTTAALAKLGLDDEAVAATKAPHIFISTGGGAMLEYLQNETLPGIEALS